MEEQPGTREGRQGEEDGGGSVSGEELVGDLSFLLHYINHFTPPPTQM